MGGPPLHEHCQEAQVSWRLGPVAAWLNTLIVCPLARPGVAPAATGRVGRRCDTAASYRACSTPWSVFYFQEEAIAVVDLLHTRYLCFSIASNKNRALEHFAGRQYPVACVAARSSIAQADLQPTTALPPVFFPAAQRLDNNNYKRNSRRTSPSASTGTTHAAQDWRCAQRQSCCHPPQCCPPGASNADPGCDIFDPIPTAQWVSSERSGVGACECVCVGERGGVRRQVT